MIRAKGKLGDHEIDCQVLNPGGWFGRAYLIEIGGSYWPLYYVVEANSAWDAIEELCETKARHHIIANPRDLGDYPEDSRHYGPNGEVLDLDHVRVYGDDSRYVTPAWPCRYYHHSQPKATWTPEDDDVTASMIEMGSVLDKSPD